MTTTEIQPKSFPSLGYVTPEIAQHVIWHFGEGGYEPGSFTLRLLAAIEAADGENRQRLMRGFEGYVIAWMLGKEWDCGIGVLREIAGQSR